ncbi:MAG: M20 family metallo-hydrolase [Cyclobacteriaceae bacterium]|nr:M20 family metallo-hydrolase [Cyclobacteriaceae bacterium]
MNPKINSTRLNKRIEEMAQFGALTSGGVKRLTLAPEDKAARDLFRQWMEELGLEIAIDEIGNMFGILKGKNEDQCIGIGSHLDSVPTGGRYDGPVGVLGALEVTQTLIENNIKLNSTLVVANYTNEEGVRFFPDMMGSLAHANPNEVSNYLKTEDKNGITVDNALKEIGYKGKMKCGTINYNHFIEIHIEQGPILEEKKIDIGIVQGVQAIHWLKLTLLGKSAHAGTTPLSARKDTFYALSKLSCFARELCNEIDNQLITIGSIDVKPNAINVVPEEVVATLDMRNLSDANLQQAKNQLEKFMATDDSFSHITVQKEILVNVPAVTFNKEVVDAIDKSCKQLDYSSYKMHSGAGHDAQILATRYPAAMIFIPSKNGVSHAVDEYSSPEQIEKGANVLLHTVLHLDQ